jgi:hypothetical protein
MPGLALDLSELDFSLPKPIKFFKKNAGLSIFDRAA